MDVPVTRSVYIYPAAISEADDGSWKTTAALSRMICKVNARRGTIFGRMIEAGNWLRRIRVSKWSLNFVGPGFVASFKGDRGLVVHSDRPMEALPFWSWGQGHGGRCSSPS